MGELSNLFEASEARPASAVQRRLAESLASPLGLTTYPESLASVPGGAALLIRCGTEKMLVVLASRGVTPAWLGAFEGERKDVAIEGLALSARICELSHGNAAALRKALAWLRPQTFGLKTAAGMGDRLGLGTPGHLRAAAGTGIVPFLAQQSIREMTRTGRTAQEVMDDATWGVFQAGWTAGFGSDADHLKTTADVDTCIAAGFTMFTVDPGDHVDNSADACGPLELAGKMESLDWGALETSGGDLSRAYVSKKVSLAGGASLAVSEEMFVRAAAKYGAAVAHTAVMYRHLSAKMGARPFELEMSVDETQTPTSTFEHYFVARELKRLGVKWVSLAPRFIGEFEKGIDYKGDLAAFERSFAEHMAVVNTLGPYKVSIHSGSDKFSIYPIIARLACGHVHLKTAGTSYLEALRVIAEVEPALFREILQFAFDRYDEDKRSYHVSADLKRVKRPGELKDNELAGILDGNDGRQLLHVTFGSVLTTKSGDGYLFRARLLDALRRNEERYYEVLEVHLGRHIAPFAVR